MPTNEERREVAARLRTLDASDWSSYSEEYNEILDACECNFGQRYGEMELHERLADLIEPEPERTCRIVEDSRKYVLCDGTELFENGCSECGGYLGEGDNYCPNCGCRTEEANDAD